ncbi:MAG: hypothetical protein ABID54_04240 [Pseudomonadota bacterium]
MTAEGGLAPIDILEVTLVGNTAMHHLLLGIDPRYLGVSPFTPALHTPLHSVLSVLLQGRSQSSP